MISYLKGKVLDIDENLMTLGVGEESVVGYSIKTPLSERYQSVEVGQTHEFFVYTHVKEDQLQPFGFLEKQEKELFLHLLQVSGVGPKAALSVLSHVQPDVLINALLTDQPELIGKIPGVGKKTLERMFIDLVGPIQKKVESGRFVVNSQSHSATRQAPSGATAKDPVVLEEAKTALSALGFKEAQFLPTLTTIIHSENSMKVEELVKEALKRLR